MNTGEQTGTFTIDQTGVDIKAHTRCRRITVREDYGSAVGATQDLAMSAPKGAGKITVLKGVNCVFTAPGPNGAYEPGQIVGTVNVIANASITAQQLEQQQI